jgi:hypothetical protein
MTEGIANLEATIERLRAATEEAREATREAHSAIKAMRRAEHDLDAAIQRCREEIPRLVDEHMAGAMKDGLDAWGASTREAATMRSLWRRMILDTSGTSGFPGRSYRGDTRAHRVIACRGAAPIVPPDCRRTGPPSASESYAETGAAVDAVVAGLACGPLETLLGVAAGPATTSTTSAAVTTTARRTCRRCAIRATATRRRLRAASPHCSGRRTAADPPSAIRASCPRPMETRP